MDELGGVRLPAALTAIEQDTTAVGFTMGSDRRTGMMLRTLAASKPGGRLLELGTGTGLSTAWLLDGMDADSRLLTVDNDPSCRAVAEKHLGRDTRAEFRLADGDALLGQLTGQSFNLIFADTWPGKYRLLDDALALLASDGLYVIDDLLPQPSWPEGHAAKVLALVANLTARPDLWVWQLAWSTGILVATRRTS
jgi:predicted O-methyltransferase YrrM